MGPLTEAFLLTANTKGWGGVYTMGAENFLFIQKGCRPECKLGHQLQLYLFFQVSDFVRGHEHFPARTVEP